MHLAILRGEVAAEPSRCTECGQERGTLSWHAEDYAWPFGGHIVGYPLCYFCHIVLHSRFRAPERWSAYLQLLRSGVRAAPVPSAKAGWAAVCSYLGKGALLVESANVPRPAPFLASLSLEKWTHPHADRVMPAGAGAALRRELAAARRARSAALFAVVR
jgi:hypothetical protein